ncbi:sulfotransferase [Thioalkalivibrio sp. ALE12]|uniref:sulfotransferase n=1 Tax=Thioalkalivibrio sp. ALE12 TaxID=1158170 RepID=UPI0009D9B0A6|nr:sulfotransferase [Thioalkalivibrio sp. ALE12]
MKIRRVLKLIVGSILKSVNIVGALLDSLASRVVRGKGPSVYIIGAPRSGTTLTFQVLSQASDLAYPDNLMSRFPQALCIGVGLSRAVRAMRAGPVYESNHGRVRGFSGHSEFGAFWYQWFPRGGVIVNDMEWGMNKTKMGRKIRLWKALEGRGIICKNVYNSLRIRQIVAADSEARFVVVRRGEADNIRSIVAGRMRMNGRYDAWRSVMPPQMRNLKIGDPAREVAAQVGFLYDEIYSQLKAAGCRWVSVSYEELCLEPRVVIKKVSDSLDVPFGTLNPGEGEDGIPGGFSLSRKKLSVEWEGKIADACDWWAKGSAYRLLERGPSPGGEEGSRHG